MPVISPIQNTSIIKKIFFKLGRGNPETISVIAFLASNTPEGHMYNVAFFLKIKRHGGLLILSPLWAKVHKQQTIFQVPVKKTVLHTHTTFHFPSR